MSELLFYGIREAMPGPRWRKLFQATWPGYRAWYLREGDHARPTLATSQRMLQRHMPELVPTWERLVDLTGGDETAARMLTLYDPPRFLPGCSQAAFGRPQPMLVRNYDYHPDLCERVVYSSAFTGRRVIGSSDCLWGLLDGMNDAGLVISLTSGGRQRGATGFAIPLVVRYLLETAETVQEVVDALNRVPVNMAYNLTLLDQRSDAATLFVQPGAAPELFSHRAATNHRGTVPDDPVHARSLRSVERQHALFNLLEKDPDLATAVAAFLKPPLYNTAYTRGFGTMYTVAYRPTQGVVDYVWPGSTWRRHFDSPDGVHTAVYRNGLGYTHDPDPPGLTGPLPGPESSAMYSRKDLARATTDELAELAEAAVEALAKRADPAAFEHLLRLVRITGECVGVAARTMAEQTSWAGVADIAGTTRQAAWERWRMR
jgi:predicted choloylglycine hydrolase